MWILLVGELRRRWLEYALGAVAIGLVVAALVAQRVLTSSAEDAVHDLAHRLGRNMLVLPASADLAAFHSQRYGGEGLREDAAEVLRASSVGEHIRLAEARLYGNVEVNGVPVILVGQELGWPSLGDVKPAVLGAAAARRLGLAPGSLVRIGDAPFQVLEVAEAPPDGLDEAVVVPLAAAQEVLRRPGEITALRLGGCWCRIDVATLAGEVEKLLPGTRALTVAGMVAAQKGSVATMQRYSGILRAVGAGVIGLVVAALVASQARRRTRELGLLVAVGAPPRAVAVLITAQGAAAGALGGLLGWAAAVPVTRAIGQQLLGQGLAAPAGLLLPAVGLAAVVGALAAAAPAWRAASLDPTAVLRES
jgi:putative ABC transport system permease protein